MWEVKFFATSLNYCQSEQVKIILYVRIGKQPISISSGSYYLQWIVTNVVTVKGPKGELKQAVDRDITIEVKEGQVNLIRPTDQIRHEQCMAYTDLY